MPKNIKVYIASPFFNAAQLNVVKDIETLFECAGIVFYSPRSEGIIKNMDDSTKKSRINFIYNKNLSMLNWCTHVLAIIDDYDKGTVWEMGYAIGRRKVTVSYSPKHFDLNVMLSESVVAHCKIKETIIPALFGKYTSEQRIDVT